MANTYKVHEEFHGLSGQRPQESLGEASYLRSLGNARNCLAHDGGIVTRKRLHDNLMRVQWPGFDLIRTEVDGQMTVLARDRPTKITSKSVGRPHTVTPVVRSHVYRLGEQVTFSATDLAEIIHFYQSLAMQIARELHQVANVLAKQSNEHAAPPYLRADWR